MFDIFKKWVDSNCKGVIFNNDDFLSVQSVFNYFLSSKSIEITESLFNKLHNKNKQKVYGITYTPYSIRKKLIEGALNKLNSINNKTFCDPCCGSGTFSIDLSIELSKININLYKSFNEMIYLKDKDRTSLLLSLSNIFCFFYNSKEDIDKIYPNIEHIDFFEVKDRYDVYITNPPYIKIQNISELEKNNLRNRYPSVFSGAIGLAPLFIYKMLNDLNDDGIIAIISQNSLFTSNSAKFLRKIIAPHVFRIDNFGGEKIFKNVGAYTCLLFLTKSLNKVFSYKDNSSVNIINNNNLSPNKWRFGDESNLEFISKIEKNGIRLKDICDIFVGIATLKDKAFTVFYDKNGWYSSQPDNRKIYIESNLVKPLIKISDFDTSKELINNKRGIIFPYKYNYKDRKWMLINEEILSINYPQTYIALIGWKNELLKRSSSKKQNSIWYEWGRRQSMSQIKEKILTKTFSKKANFMLDKSDSLISNGYGLKIKDNRFNVNFLLKVLNSDFFEEYIKKTSYNISGNYQCYQKNFIENFRLPEIIIHYQNDVILNKVDINSLLNGTL